MNKQILWLTILLASSVFATAQDAKQIIQKSYNNCKAIRSGSYEMANYFKSMTSTDTGMFVIHCDFKKLTGDTLFPVAFHYQQFKDKELFTAAIYTGEELIDLDPSDSTASVMQKKIWSEGIYNSRGQYNFFTPFIDNKTTPSPLGDSSNAHNYSYKLIGEEKVLGKKCYHIQINIAPEKEKGDVQLTKTELHYWITKKDFIAIQYSLEYGLILDNIPMQQYQKQQLIKYKLNSLKNDKALTLEGIPSFYAISDYVPSEPQEPLPIGSVAPDWTLMSLAGDSVSLKSLQGRVVIIDFFYKSCYPCMKALPAMQSLHDKYKDKGLTVVGIDPYDEKDSDIAEFLGKRNINYTILLCDKTLPTKYLVSGYPTVYVLDKDGKILSTHSGYSPTMEEELEAIIKEKL
jgi:peroxiredoxin